MRGLIGLAVIAAFVLSGSTFAQAMSCAEKCTANCGGKGAYCFNNFGLHRGQRNKPPIPQLTKAAGSDVLARAFAWTSDRWPGF